MRNIRENVREIGKRVIWSTDDAGIFVETWTESKIVDRNKLIAEKAILESQLVPLSDEQYKELGKTSYHLASTQEQVNAINLELQKYG